MKKLDIICIIIGVICFLLAGYIVYSKFFKENKIDFNEEEYPPFLLFSGDDGS